MEGRWSVWSITRTLLPLLVVLTAFELVGGLTLGSVESAFRRNPTLLVLVPVTIGTAGNLGSVLSARLSTALHLGTLAFEPSDETLLGYTATVVALAVTVFPVVGGGGWLIVHLTGDPRLSLGTVLAVAITSGLLLAVFAIAVTVSVTYAAFHFHLDPDDVVIPVVTNVCDVTGVLVLVGVVQVIVP